MKPTQLTSVVYPVSFNAENGSYIHTIRVYMTDELGNLYVSNPNDENGPRWVLNVPSPENSKTDTAKAEKPEPKEYVTNKPSPFGVDLKKKAKKTEGEE